MGCATKTIKCTLFIFNTLWAILGVLLLLLAGFGWDAMPQNYAIGIIALGCVILLTFLFGCFGAVRESARSLWTYAVMLLILLVLTIVFICYNTRDVFKNYALKEIDDLWDQEIIQSGAMDSKQIIYECCGRNSFADYGRINRQLPSSCCKDGNCINPLNVYVTGCLTKVEEAFSNESLTTEISEWCLLGLNIIVLVLSTILAIHYTNQRRRYNY
ncbi:tetraspanin-6 [Lucilia sericata]|uniref:tetraspanin-6 n=1 Tax=Lucilia sericata TaxID=13632 RepID=UPI0018A7F02D|nr:tetraspanin-6 [Lucilia sericata]